MLKVGTSFSVSFIVYRKGDIVKQPMKSRDVLPKNVPGVGWGGVGWVTRVRWVTQGWGGDRVHHTGGAGSHRGGWGRVGHVGVEWGGMWWGGVSHAGVGWVM